MKKNEKIKEIILDQLRKIPIVEAACQKAGISRMTFYRWKKEDKEFAEEIEKALLDGYSLINDLAENQLIGSVKDRNFQAISYWLRHHHPTYAQKVEITANIKSPRDELTPEQEEVVREALRLASLTQEPDNINQLQNHGQQSNEEPRQENEQRPAAGPGGTNAKG